MDRRRGGSREGKKEAGGLTKGGAETEGWEKEAGGWAEGGAEGGW